MLTGHRLSPPTPQRGREPGKVGQELHAWARALHGGGASGAGSEIAGPSGWHREAHLWLKAVSAPGRLWAGLCVPPGKWVQGLEVEGDTRKAPETRESWRWPSICTGHQN